MNDFMENRQVILSDLLSGVPYQIINGSENITIQHVTADSRDILPATLFVCIRGYRFDGHHYIQNACAAGAAAVVVEDASAAEFLMGSSVTVILVEKSRQSAAYIAANWYGNPADRLNVIAITGTKGKTTATHMISSILNAAGIPTGTIGTMGAVFAGRQLETANTTPEPFTLHRLFREMYDAGCTHVIIEASSQGFKLDRTAGICFKYGLFLNIAKEHIGEEEHHSFEEYLQCKMAIFHQSERMIVNKGNPVWNYLSLSQQQESITFSASGPADYYSTHCTPSLGTPDDFYLGITFDVKGLLDGEVNMPINLRMPGTYNVDNALAAIALTHSIGVDAQTIVDALASFEVEGRTQLVSKAYAHGQTVLLDYSHNAVSMENLLTTLRDYCQGRIICVFGARGNRTKTRRYAIGSAAGKFADHIVLTSDNLTDETFLEANQQVIEGIQSQNGSYELVEDRAKAIQHALTIARREDFVVVTGKGHEHYQLIDGKPVYFSEEAVVNDFFDSLD